MDGGDFDSRSGRRGLATELLSIVRAKQSKLVASDRASVLTLYAS